MSQQTHTHTHAHTHLSQFTFVAFTQNDTRETEMQLCDLRVGERAEPAQGKRTKLLPIKKKKKT